MKKILALLLALSFVITLAACGGNDDEETTETETEDVVDTTLGEEDTSEEDITGETEPGETEDASTEASTNGAEDSTAPDDTTQGGTEAPDDTTQAPSYNAPVNGSTAEIVSYYNDALNDSKNYKGKVKVDRRTGSYALIEEFSIGLLKGTAEKMLEPINDWPKAESATFSNGKSGEKDLLTYLPPSERSTESKLTPAGVKSATCVQQGDQFKVNIQLVEEKGNDINFIPTHHASTMDTLAVTADDLDPFSLNEAEITYTGATIEAIVDAEGRLTSLKIHEPAYIKGKLGYGSFNLINAAIDGGYRYEAMLNYQ